LPRAGAEAWLELHIKNSSGGATKIVQRTLLVEYLRSAKPIPRIDCHKCQASVGLLPASAGGGSGPPAPRCARKAPRKNFDDDDQEQREVLNLPMEAALKPLEINAAFRRLAKTAHPDAGGSNEHYRRIAEARDALLAQFASTSWACGHMRSKGEKRPVASPRRLTARLSFIHDFIELHLAQHRERYHDP
jgi:hypothetical protein